MIPLRDTIRSQTTPVVTYAILAVNLVIFGIQAVSPDGGQAIVQDYGAVPDRVIGFVFGDVGFMAGVLPLFTYMFLHGGFMHIAGNSLFLWVFGDNVEDHFGHVGFLFFYILAGIGAILIQIAISLFSGGGQAPVIGASGAIAGIMGAYFVLYPQARVVTLVPIFIFIHIMEVPAILFLGLWILLQFLSASSGGEGVAWWAHIGGFFVGIVLLLAFNVLFARRKKGRMWRDGGNGRGNGRGNGGKVHYIN